MNSVNIGERFWDREGSQTRGHRRLRSWRRRPKQPVFPFEKVRTLPQLTDQTPHAHWAEALHCLLHEISWCAIHSAPLLMRTVSALAIALLAATNIMRAQSD